jgi:hypothetical protein
MRAALSLAKHSGVVSPVHLLVAVAEADGPSTIYRLTASRDSEERWRRSTPGRARRTSLLGISTAPRSTPTPSRQAVPANRGPGGEEKRSAPSISPSSSSTKGSLMSSTPSVEPGPTKRAAPGGVRGNRSHG